MSEGRRAPGCCWGSLGVHASSCICTYAQHGWGLGRSRQTVAALARPAAADQLAASVGCLSWQVRPVAEDEMFKVLRTGKRKKKEWKRMVTKVRGRAVCCARNRPRCSMCWQPEG